MEKRKKEDPRTARPRPPFDDPRRSAMEMLRWARPLLTDDEVRQSEGLARAFLDGAGPPLQEELNRLRRQTDDVILDEVPYWEGWYLSCREPLPVHVNPFYLLDEAALPAEEDRCRLAARLALAAASFCLDIDRGQVEPDRFREETLCMVPYGKLFRCSRGAFPVRDRQILGEASSLEGRSAVVFVGGRPFLLELISPDGALRDLDETAAHLRSLVAGGTVEALPLGLMTCLDRERAAAFRKEFTAASSENVAALKAIEGALFALRLDGPCGPSLDERARHFLFDEGQNGWYEKSFQIIVTADGAAGLNFEHSLRDGTYLGRLVKELLARSSRPGGEGRLPLGPRPIPYVLDDGLKGELARAERACRDLSARRRQRLYRFDTFGRERVKAGCLSPDAFVQIAFLVAQRALWREWRSVYESVQMRRFRLGRTEGTRPLTDEAAAFVRAFRGGGGREELVGLLLASGEAHRRRIDQCLDGRGVEGHLGLLKRIWELRGEALGLDRPTLFDSPAWLKLTSNFFSSSTTAGVGLTLAGYGPVQIGGLGLRYLSRPDHFLFHVSSWAEEDKGEGFVEALDEALPVLGSLLK